MPHAAPVVNAALTLYDKGARPQASVLSRFMAQAPSHEEMQDALVRMYRLVEDMMPGVRHIAMQNYQELNEAPIEARRCVFRSSLACALPTSHNLSLVMDGLRITLNDHGNGTYDVELRPGEVEESIHFERLLHFMANRNCFTEHGELREHRYE